MIFSTYGQILEINIKKSAKMRGQAFVVFKDKIQSTEALRALQNFRFMGKELSIHYAKSQSEIVAKREGTFNPLAKRKEKLKLLKKHDAEGEIKKDEENKGIKEKKDETHAEKPESKISNVLKVKELPPIVTQEMLDALFKQYDGYIRAQIIPEKAIAFIEYDTEEQAAKALIGLKDFKITNELTLKVDYS